MSFPSDFQLTLLLLPVSNVSSPFTFLISFNSDVSEMVPFSGFFSHSDTVVFFTFPLASAFTYTDSSFENPVSSESVAWSANTFSAVSFNS